MNELGQYFTESKFSELLVNYIHVAQPNRVLDLGIGNGSLTFAAYQKWQKADFHAVDIDLNNISYKEYPSTIKIFHNNGLDYNINRKIKIKLNSIDVAVCNPPYLKLKNTYQYNKLLSKSGFTSPLRLLTTDIIFLAQNLRFLREGGVLGIILPDGLITSHDYNLFRKDLLCNHTLLAVIQLPEKIFDKTEARTHILIIQKGQSNYKDVNLYKADNEGKCIGHITVSRDNLIFRMDYNYHSWSNKLINKRTLESIGATIQRGRMSRKELVEKRIRHFHTTDFKHYGKEIFITEEDSNIKILSASTNDILISRVGNIGKLCIIRSGEIPISDCIYRLRVPNAYVEEIWNELNSENASKWFQAHSHGVCSQVISKSDLFKFTF